MGILVAFLALVVLMTPQSSVNLGGQPQGLNGESSVNVGDASDAGQD